MDASEYVKLYKDGGVIMGLLMIHVGGHTSNSNIEVHDIRFVVADKIEDSFEELKNQWYGLDLHIDSYKEITEIDGYKIIINESSIENLYFINLGGIDPDKLCEVHENTFVIASSFEEAKQKGKDLIKTFKYINHVDTVVNVSKIIPLKIGFEKGNYTYNNAGDYQGYIVLVSKQK